MVWPILLARSSCGQGGVPRNASIFPWTKSSVGLAFSVRIAKLAVVVVPKGGRLYRHVVSLLLLPCLLLPQSALLAHAHGGGQPAGHDQRDKRQRKIAVLKEQ